MRNRTLQTFVRADFRAMNSAEKEKNIKDFYKKTFFC